MRDIDQTAKALATCPPSPPYKHGTGGLGRINNCLVPCCNCCGQKPPKCSSPQIGFKPPNCCEMCGLTHDTIHSPNYLSGKPIAVISGTGCVLDATWPLQCGYFGVFQIPFCAPQMSGLNMKATCHYTAGTTSGRPFPAQAFTYSLNVGGFGLANNCQSFGVPFVPGQPTGESILTGSCYPLNLTGTFFLYHNFNFGPLIPGCPCGCGPGGNITITTDMGGN